MNSEVNTVPENMEEAVNENTEITAPEKTEIDIKNMDFFSSMKKSYPVTNDTTVEFFSILVSFVITLITIMAVGLIPVNTSTDSYKGILTTEAMSNCRPEPLEMPMYILTVVLVPLVFLASYCILKKRLAPVPIVLTNTIQYVFLIAVCVISFLAYYISRNATLHFAIGFRLTLFFLVPLTAVVLFSVILAQKIKRKKHQTVIFVAVLTLLFAYAIWRIATINFSVQVSRYNYHHYYAVWYPIVKVSQGHTIGTDFKCIYGFYPYIAAPILKLLGGVNQASSSIFFTGLMAIIAAAYSVFSFKFIKNKILALFISVACSIYGPFSILGDQSNGGVKMYLQYYPLRAICIATVLFAIVITSSIKSKRIKFIFDIIVCVVLGLGVVWNFETGAIAVIIWAAYRVFASALDNKLFSKKTFIAFVKALIYAVISFSEFFILVSLITYVRSGQILPLKDMLFGITTFAGMGFFMMKIKFGLWVVMAVVLSLALIRVIPYLTKYKDAPEELKSNITGLFITAVTGAGTLTYYVGRSHPSNYLFALPITAVCCGLLYEYNLYFYNAQKKDMSAGSKVLDWIKRIMCITFISALLIPAGGNFIQSFSADFSKCHYPKGKDLAEIKMRNKGIKKWADENNNGKIPNNLLTYSVFTDEVLGKKSYEKVCDQVDWFYLDNARTYLTFIKEHSDECFMINAECVITLKTELDSEWKETIKNFKKTAEIKDTYFDNVYIYTPKSSSK